MNGMLKTQRKKVLCAAAALAMMFIIVASMTAYAANNPLWFAVKQVVVSSSASAETTFTYRLKPLDPGIPMPEGSTAEGYTFTISGNNSVQIGPLDYTRSNVYRYELFQVVESAKRGYTYDTRIYMIHVYVDAELNVNVLILNEEGAKVEKTEFRNGYKESPDRPDRPDPKEPKPPVNPSTPSSTPPANNITVDNENETEFEIDDFDAALAGVSGQILDPPVRKTVSGDPHIKSNFAFKMVAQDKAFPMPEGSVNGEKVIYIEGSGENFFGSCPYDRLGTFYYNVYEVNSGAKGYIYDTAVYTITDTMKMEDGVLVLSRIITNEMNKQVTTLSFINTYTLNDGPKTGDSMNTTHNIILFALGGVLSIGATVYLVSGRKERRRA